MFQDKITHFAAFHMFLMVYFNPFSAGHVITRFFTHPPFSKVLEQCKVMFSCLQSDILTREKW